MRLSKIKLAGFKSFVDPTTISFPSNLVGVVGPNGCGKSNVIDAVRWVMGESSASRLRGDSMTDVIFNGSSARKPVGSASIELVFDNSDAKVGGQYAKYAEISIRRTVSRDSISTYFLNGTRCRRKDITHIFLGTGLGPRSYSIIEQGMISRLIEAKPEEMRVYLEEAAGISKYKDRRRDTEHRIRHTKENLARLADLLDEVEKQLKHLDRQAKTAERYKRYKAEERRTGAELLALKLAALDAGAREHERRLAERETALEAAIARQRRLEADIERSRALHAERSDEFNAVQGLFYKVGAEIARLEQSIEHGRELRERREQDLEQAREGAAEIRAHIEQDRAELRQLELSLNELAPGLGEARRAAEASAQSLARAEAAMTEWQETWEAFNREAGDAERTAEVAAARIEHLEGELDQLERQQAKLTETDQPVSPDELRETLAAATAAERAEAERVAGSESALEMLTARIGRLRERVESLGDALARARERHQQTLGRHASLEALQKAARSEGGAEAWLERGGLAEAPRLAQRLVVSDGWETAVETVLGDHLQAVCVEELAALEERLASALPEGTLTLIEDRGAPDGGVAGSLADKVSGAPGGVLRRLAAVRLADTLSDALSLRTRLDDGESVVTREGVWLGRDWLRVAREADTGAGVIGREQELRSLEQGLAAERETLTERERTLEQAQRELRELETEHERVRKAATARHLAHAEATAELEAARRRLEEAETRVAAAARRGHELAEERRTARRRLEETRAELERAEATVASCAARRATLSEQREALRAELARVREQAGQDREAAQELAIRYESRRSSKESANQNLARMQSQLAQFRRREEELAGQLGASDAPLATQRAELERQLERRVGVEAELAEARGRMEAVDAELRAFEQQRADCEREVEQARATVDEARMAAQETRVRRESLAEQFDATGFVLETVLAELEEGAAVEAWEERLAKLTRRIERLGAINLAAIDEFREQSERKQYLDAQLEDLTTALQTLENAIRKIDRETRTRFKETFDRVDAGFKRLFPRLFGGGHAYLDLTGDDLLTAGVTVMARPPGKRNSTIHLLSGGEKALTAVALVFAIFELNPAPFCMLDEVDAPLDDANVARFCDIVRDKSSEVQFVFITHNKGTMEMARQLTGVTMQEPGVSRLVAVDIDEAVKMAAS